MGKPATIHRMNGSRRQAIILRAGKDRLRRRVVLVQFIAGASGCIVVGLLTATRAPGMGWRVVGTWLAGVGVNYDALALHTMSLSRGGALDRELAGVDVASELRRYTYLQVWIVVPLLLVVLAISQLRRRPSPPRTG